MKASTSSMALASAAILLLLGGTTAAFADSQQQLNLTIPNGVVTNLGNQFYTVSGGQVAYGAINGLFLYPGATIDYGFFASQNGLSTEGYGSLQLTGTTASGASTGVSGTFSIDSVQQAIQIGNSEVPSFFIASAPNVLVTIGGSTQPLGQPLFIENPYANPFGAPIVIASADCLMTATSCTFLVAATYDYGTILWQGSQVQGAMSGTLGTAPAAGNDGEDSASTASGTLGTAPAAGTFTLTGNEVEDLVAGTAADMGTIAFSNMSPASLNAVGTYHGTSFIPTQGAIDCSPPGLPGTCTMTGFQSQGTFNANGIHGSYSTSWTVPAFGFTTQIQATVSPNHHSSDSGDSWYSGMFGFLGFLGFLGYL